MINDQNETNSQWMNGNNVLVIDIKRNEKESRKKLIYIEIYIETSLYQISKKNR